MMRVDPRGTARAVANAADDRQSAALDRARAVSRRQAALLAAAGLDAPERRWFVVETFAGKEKAVHKLLADSGLTCALPVEKRMKRVRKANRLVEVEEVACKGCVFAMLHPCDEIWAWLAGQKGVRGVIGGYDAPLSIDDETFCEFMAFLASDREAKDVLRQAFMVGERVVIRSGRLRGQEGEVLAMVNRMRAVIAVTMFGRQTRVRLDLAQIEKPE